MKNRVNKKDLFKALVKAVGHENVLSSAADLLAYSYDATGECSLPDVVVLPNSTAQVSAVIKIAQQQQVPVIARGAGTNLSGGTIPHRGGIVLELSHLNQVQSMDIAQQRAVVEPGVINLDLQNLLKPYGFMFAPDPSSQKSSTLGGNIGEDSGGPHCLKYGVTHNHVLSMEVVLADGQIVQVGAPTSDTFGYDLAGLLVGSEGTLGVATKIVLRIMHLPESFQTMLAIFETLEDAFQSASDIIAAGIVPGALEFMDAPVIKAVEASVHAGYPLDAEAVLLIELDVLKEAAAPQVEQITNICRKNKAREVKSAQTAAERDVLWAGRRGAFGAVARVRPAYACHDATVPRNKLVPMFREVGKIAEKYQLLIGQVAHAGDGNFHPLIMFDNRNPDEKQRVHKAGKEILAAGAALGGTITGEHGIGLEKQDSMPLLFTPIELNLMRRVKSVFDPKEILNPGKIFPPPGKEPPVAVKSSEATSAVKGKSLYDKLVAILSPENVLNDANKLTAYQIDGLTPSLVVFPSNAEQIVQIVKIANSDGVPVTPWGNGSKQALGLPVTKVGIVTCLKHINHLVELDTPNLTAVVEAGMSLSDFKKELVKQGLYFPLEPEDMEAATIGGTLAANSSGPKRLAYGTARDLVLGVTVVTPTGEIIRAGIKTMKNVAGYDMRKLFLGSWGTLGIITQAIIRLSYTPQDHKTVLLKFSGIKDAAQVANGVLNSCLRPQAIELIDAEAASSAGVKDGLNLQKDELLLLVSAAGSKEEVERHVKEIQAMGEANHAKVINVLSGTEEEKVWTAQRQIWRNSPPGIVRGKAVVPINKFEDMFQEIQNVATKHKLSVGITGRAGSGLLYPAFSTKDSARDSEMLAAVGDLTQSAGKLGWFFMVESGSLELRQAYDLISRRSDYPLMKRLKQAFDPGNIFNPGKVVRNL